jgi:hypothetical protein
MDVLVDFLLLFTFEDRGPLIHKSAHGLHYVLARKGQQRFSVQHNVDQRRPRDPCCKGLPLWLLVSPFSSFKTVTD